MAQIDLDTLPKSPKEAKELGSKLYFNGRPCPRGHVAPKYTSARKCTACAPIESSARIAEIVEWGRQNKGSRLVAQRKWRAANAEQANASNRRYEKTPAGRAARKRKEQTPNAVIRGRLYSRLSIAVRAQSAEKAGRTRDLTGCSWEYLKAWLEAQFLPGMSWDDRSAWHIDHIRPCASFDLTDPEQQKECFHYSNLQPLWALDNIKKGARLAA
jgi:hypothetical protein